MRKKIWVNNFEAPIKELSTKRQDKVTCGCRSAYLETAVNPFKCRLNIARTHHLYEAREAIKCFQLGWHGVEERGSQHIHALDIGKTRGRCVLDVCRSK